MKNKGSHFKIYNTPVSWDDVDEMVQRLVKIIKNSDFRPAIITGIPRGGWIIGALVAQYLDVKEILPLCVDKSISPYKVNMASIGNLKNKKILLVEDSLETGKSLEAAVEAILMLGASVETASLLVSPKAIIKPNFYLGVQEISDFPWDIK